MTTRFLLPLVFTLAVGAASGTAAQSATPATAGAPDGTGLIPREALFGNPERANVRLSPDGRHIAYLAPRDGVMNVWVAPVDDLDAVEPITSDTGRGIQGFFWAYTNEHILYVQDGDGDENWRVYAVRLDDQSVRDLTPLDGVQARVQAVSPDHPGSILVGLNDRIPQLHDLYRVDLATGERELALQNDGFLGFLTDDDYAVQFAIAPTPDGGMVVLRREGDTWAAEPFAVIGQEDALTTAPVAIGGRGRTVVMIDSRGRDTAALTETDLETGETTVVYENPLADVSDAMVHPTEHRIEAAASNRLRAEWTVLDERIERDFARLREIEDAEFHVISRTLDDRTWLVAYTLDVSPVRYYLYDRDADTVTFLFTNNTALEGQPLAQMQPVVIPARDGLELVSYLTLPAGTTLDADGRSSEPLPTVLLVHGGPWARDSWGYDAQHQWLANRGYAVLSVNFRGSTGFGKAFVNAGDLEWGAAMHDDLLDAVDWAVQHGIADPERVAIMGGSYGGYAALVGLTFTPDVFAAGVSIVGPSNLVTLLESIPPYWEPQVELFATRVGDHRTPEGRALLEERSPLGRVETIRRPLLIAQGANDPRVKREESDQIVDAMTERGIPVTYALYSDEGHGFTRAENRLSFFAITEAFLAEHLGGRYEPIGDAFQGSSVTVPTGAADVPGLQEALDQ